MIVRFGDCELDVGRRELRAGGDPVHVEPQVFDLLTYLIANRERVVGKDELIKAVWHGRIVSDVTLNSRVNAARRVISDNGKAQALIRTLPRKGFRFIGTIAEEASGSVSSVPARSAGPNLRRQEVSFCRTSDGVNLAFATCGEGMPLVKTGMWLTHIELDWQSPIWSPLYARLASQFRLIRYDPRGCGLSEREVGDITFEGFVRDLETVVDALGHERVALLGLSQGAAVSIAYAARHPERVSHLVLSGGYPLGWRKRGSAAEIATREALLVLMQLGWGQDNPAFRQVFTARLWPDTTPEQMRSWDELQRISATPENAVRVQRTLGDIDVVDLLPSIKARTLVLHSRGDILPLEMGLMLAREVPNARFVEIDSRNHFPLVHESVWSRYVDEISAFLKEQ